MRNFSFNGITKDYVTALRGSNRQPWAPVEREYQEVPGRPGAYLKKKRKTKPRPLLIPVLIQADSIEGLQKIKEDFAAWLIHDEAKPLIFDDEPDRTYYAVVDGDFDPDEIVSLGEGTIPFICPDPYKYGKEKSINVTTAPVVNEGSTDSNVIFTVTFTAAASEFMITHQETGDWVRVVWNFVIGSKLEIDLTKRKIKIDNNVRMAAYDWRSSPFSLLPGENTFVVEPSGKATTNIKFRPRWK